jgi:hypothetical protein
MSDHGFTEEELHAHLVALADGQLDRETAKKIMALVEKDQILAAKLSEFKKTKQLLEELYSVKSAQTPLHIATKIRALSGAPETSNIITLADRFKTVARTFTSTQSLLQIAAALTLGVFLSPSLLESVTEAQFDANRSQLTLRGAQQTTFNPELISIFNLMIKDGNGAFTTLVNPGSKINLGAPFIIQIQPPISGYIEVSEEGTSSSTFFAGPAIKGQTIILPQVFMLENQNRFDVIAKFKNAEENLVYSLSYTTE